MLSPRQSVRITYQSMSRGTLRDRLIEHVTSRACEILGVQEVERLTIHTESESNGQVHQTIVLTLWNGEMKQVMV